VARKYPLKNLMATYLRDGFGRRKRLWDGWPILCYSRIGTTKVGAPLFAPLEGWGCDNIRGTTLSRFSFEADS